MLIIASQCCGKTFYCRRHENTVDFTFSEATYESFPKSFRELFPNYLKEQIEKNIVLINWRLFKKITEEFNIDFKPDYVFYPEPTEENLNFRLNTLSVRRKENERFINHYKETFYRNFNEMRSKFNNIILLKPNEFISNYLD